MGKRGRPWGSGRLSLADQEEIERAVRIRNSLREKELAKRYKVPKSVISSFIRRLYRKWRVELVPSTSTGVPRETQERAEAESASAEGEGRHALPGT